MSKILELVLNKFLIYAIKRGLFCVWTKAYNPSMNCIKNQVIKIKFTVQNDLLFWLKVGQQVRKGGVKDGKKVKIEQIRELRFF